MPVVEEQAEEEAEGVLLLEILVAEEVHHLVAKPASSATKKVTSQESVPILVTVVVAEVVLEAAAELASNAIRRGTWHESALIPLRMMMVAAAAEVEAVVDQ